MLKNDSPLFVRNLLDQSQAGVSKGKGHIPPLLGLFGAIRVPYPKGLKC